MKFLNRMALANTAVDLKKIDRDLKAVYAALDVVLEKISDDRDLAVGAEFKKLLSVQESVHDAMLSLEEYQEQLET